MTVGLNTLIAIFPDLTSDTGRDFSSTLSFPSPSAFRSALGSWPGISSSRTLSPVRQLARHRDHHQRGNDRRVFSGFRLHRDSPFRIPPGRADSACPTAGPGSPFRIDHHLFLLLAGKDGPARTPSFRRSGSKGSPWKRKAWKPVCGSFRLRSSPTSCSTASPTF